MLICEDSHIHSQAQPTPEMTNSNINQKYQKAISNINKLELYCEQWLKSQTLQHYYQLTQEALPDSNKLQETPLKGQNELELLKSTTNLYISNLRQVFLSQGFMKLLTDAQLTLFFEDQYRLIENKVKLLEDIQKLKLFKGYPETQKRTYSLSANIILKKWLLKNYNNPYPNEKGLKKLMKKTNLTKQQILNWFINSRNSFKKSQQKESKFQKLVSSTFQTLIGYKKITKSQSLTDSTFIKNQNQNYSVF